MNTFIYLMQIVYMSLCINKCTLKFRNNRTFLDVKAMYECYITTDWTYPSTHIALPLICARCHILCKHALFFNKNWKKTYLHVFFNSFGFCGKCKRRWYKARSYWSRTVLCQIYWEKPFRSSWSFVGNFKNTLKCTIIFCGNQNIFCTTESMLCLCYIVFSCYIAMVVMTNFWARSIKKCITFKTFFQHGFKSSRWQT